MSNVTRIYYDSMPGMLARFDETAHRDRADFRNLSELISWQKREREVLAELTGLDRLMNTDCNEPDTGRSHRVSDPAERLTLEGGGITISCGDTAGATLTRYKCLFKVDEYTVMPMYILVPAPDRDVRKKGTWIALAGHQGGGKESVAGVRDIPEIAEKIDFFNYDYGLQLAGKGYTVICPDPRGFGERRDRAAWGDSPDKLLSCSCRNISNMAIPLGLSVIGLCTYDICRLLDHLEGASGRDLGLMKELRIEPDDISVIGFSGGGMQALYVSALRQDIRRTIISGYMYGFRDSMLLLNNNCSCNYVPGLWEHLDMGDIACLIAPAPLVIQSCREDHLNGPRGLENVYEQMSLIRRAYELYGAQDMLRHDIRPGGHHFHSGCFGLIGE